MTQQGLQRQTVLAPVAARAEEQKTVARAADEMDVFRLGEVFSKSGYFADAKDAAQSIVKVLAGRELGIGPVASMTGIYIVKGRVTLSANLIGACIKRSGRYNYRVRRMDETGCEIEFFEGSASVGVSTFTEEDAKKAQLNSGENYKKFARNMYFARAMSNGAKWYTPDVFSGPIYTPDELGERVNEEGEIIVGASAAVARPAVVEAEPADSPEVAEIKRQVREACVTLGYDEAKQENALGRLKGMTARQMQGALASLNKLIAKKKEELELRASILAVFSTYGWEEKDISEYLGKNYGGVALDDMSYAQLNQVYVDLDVESEKGGQA